MNARPVFCKLFPFLFWLNITPGEEVILGIAIASLAHLMGMAVMLL